MAPDLPISNLLPAEARNALIAAAKTVHSAADPLRRQKAIEKTTQRIKSQYPEFFKTPKEPQP